MPQLGLIRQILSTSKRMAREHRPVSSYIPFACITHGGADPVGLGDKAEIGSISSVFCGASRKRDLYVGSIKANIGHLEAASGVSGLIKATMMLKKNQIPPHIDLITPKPSLRLEERRIMVRKQIRNAMDPAC
jgi:acyl transferase domain-containing protein